MPVDGGGRVRVRTQTGSVWSRLRNRELIVRPYFIDISTVITLVLPASIESSRAGVDDPVGSLDCSQLLEFRGNCGGKTRECCRTIFRERGRVLSNRGFKTIGAVQPHGQLDAEGVDPRGIAVKLRGTDRILEEIVVIVCAVAHASQVDIDSSRGVGGHIEKLLFGDRMGFRDAIDRDAPEDLAVGKLAVGAI